MHPVTSSCKYPKTRRLMGFGVSSVANTKGLRYHTPGCLQSRQRLLHQEDLFLLSCSLVGFNQSCVFMTAPAPVSHRSSAGPSTTTNKCVRSKSSPSPPPGIQTRQRISMDFIQIWKCGACVFMHLHNQAQHSLSLPMHIHTLRFTNAHCCTYIDNIIVSEPFREGCNEPTWRAARTSSSSASHRTACWISRMS